MLGCVVPRQCPSKPRRHDIPRRKHGRRIGPGTSRTGGCAGPESRRVVIVIQRPLSSRPDSARARAQVAIPLLSRGVLEPMAELQGSADDRQVFSPPCREMGIVCVCVCVCVPGG